MNAAPAVDARRPSIASARSPLAVEISEARDAVERRAALRLAEPVSTAECGTAPCRA